MMSSELMNARYSICAVFFQARFQSCQGFADGSDSRAGFADCANRLARHAIAPRQTLSAISPGFEPRSMEFLERLMDIVKSIDQSIWFIWRVRHRVR
jgi:hypothetical protein